MPTTAAAAIDKLADLAGSLYSLPSVAMDVLRMTESDAVDAHELKQAIERDPALAAKLLRVVNSSLFGLSGEVGDLNQAVAMLGVKPLKLLVLGFSLPHRLFAGAARDALQRYWTVSLTRAVSARALATRFPSVNGDEAMLAGLLRGLGQLVLIQQLGDAYVRLVDDATGERLAELERESLGFSHAQLTAALLRRWRLPARLARAVEEAESDCAASQRKLSPLGQTLALAELTTQLVLDRRLDALPELLERGDAWCGLSKPALNVALAPLQDQVDGLAEAMSVELAPGLNYEQVILDAHARLALSVEEAVSELLGAADDRAAEELLGETHDVRLAMRAFLRGDTRRAEAMLTRAEGAHARPARAQNEAADTAPHGPLTEAAHEELVEAVAKAAHRCRAKRMELSLVLVRATAPEGVGQQRVDREVSGVLAATLELWQLEHAPRLALGDGLTALLLPGVDRREAVALARRACAAPLTRAPSARLRVGVASIGIIPHRFDPQRLLEGAAGCLSTAMVSGASAVKSIEVY